MTGSERHDACNDCYGRVHRNLMLSCVQARRSAKQGCRAFLVLVTASDIAEAQLNSVEMQPDPASPIRPTTFMPHPTLHADLSAYVAELREQYADVLAEPSGLPPDEGAEHVTPVVPDYQKFFSAWTGCHLQSCTKCRDKSQICWQSSSLSPPPVHMELPFCFWKTRLESCEWSWTIEPSTRVQ